MTALIWTRSISAVHLLDPSHQWQRVGQSLMDPCVRLSSRSLWKRITSLCAMFEQDTQQTVVFVKSQTKCLFWDRSEMCDRLPQTQAHVVQSSCLQGGGLHSPKEELVLYTLIVNLKSLSSFTAFDSLRPDAACFGNTFTKCYSTANTSRQYVQNDHNFIPSVCQQELELLNTI